MSKILLFSVLFALSFAFAQEGAIKFQISLDSTGMPVAAPPKPETPQKLGLASNRPLNLAELSVKDTASFETYSRRLAIVQDSIAAMQKEIENSKKRTAAQMPPLEPKGEYEKQVEFDARKEKRERELGDRMIRDYKPFADRLSDLEKAKKKIEDNRHALLCTIDIKTNPTAASISLNNEEIGASPIEYTRALPGNSVLKIQRDGYEPWDTTLALQPTQKIKLNVVLQEKSIFSKEGEINISRTIARDTTVEGYLRRISLVKDRIVQVDVEIINILDNFSNTYPALELQRQDESLDDFEHRKTKWREEGIAQVVVLKQKHKAYKEKLERSIEALENNIIATESQLIAEAHPNAQITLGAYDVEKEVFEFEVQDSANAKSPFRFVGIVGIPRDTAKAMNRSTDGFMTSISYLNFPFVSKDSSSYFNLAMKELALSRKAVPLKVDGAFKPVGKFEFMEGYDQWHEHADSLLNGKLRTNPCLDFDYVIGKKACGAGMGIAESGSSSDSESSLGWRGWTRILTFTAAAAFGTLAVMRQLDVGKNEDKQSDLKKEGLSIPKDDPNRPEFDYRWKYNEDQLQENKNSRNIFGALAGVFVVGAVLTFTF